MRLLSASSPAAIALAGLVGLAAPAVEAVPLSFTGYAVDNGDVNGDQDRDLSDPIYLLDHLFLGGPAPLLLAHCDADEPVVANGDANGDAAVDMSDGVHLLNWLFGGGPEPVDACTREGEGAGGHGHHCHNRVAPPGSRAYGKSLAEWLETYWRWYFGSNQDLTQSKVGRVQLLPIPAGEVISGSFTPEDPALIRGRLEITLRPGTPFVLPLFAWTSETYNNGTPDDPPFPDDLLLASVSPNLTIDGCPVVTDENERRFYVSRTELSPPIVYPEPSSYGSIAAIAFQSCGIVAHPLPPGVHEIRLHEPYIVANPPLGLSAFGVIYDNTWIVTVSAH